MTYTLTHNGNTPRNQWTDNNPVDFKHMANIIAQHIETSDNAEFNFTIWQFGFPVIEVNTKLDRVRLDADLQSNEHHYIVTAIKRAIKSRKAS